MLAGAVADAGFDGIRCHDGGTYVCIEGPAFSTRAESRWYRSLGAAVIGMTNMPEARLAREAEIAYASLNLVTDWDCWHPQQACGSAEMALANLQANAQRAQVVLAPRGTADCTGLAPVGRPHRARRRAGDAGRRDDRGRAAEAAGLDRAAAVTLS